jgi:16S rRNA (uracil1498-N3)-methyltransferase
MLQGISGFDVALMAALSKDALPLSRALDEGASRRRVLLLVGPEGGFSESEIDRARSSGVQPITLGPRRLRAETAAVVFCAMVLFRLGEMDERGIHLPPAGAENP